MTGNSVCGTPSQMQFSGIRHGIMEIVRDVIYDREVLHSTRLHLFTLPCGTMTLDYDGHPLLKSFERTNMILPGQLPVPSVFVIKAIRCVFLERDGSVVSINDPIYWETRIDLKLTSKTYWHSLAAYVADPAILLAATDWSKIPAEERAKLIEIVTAKTTCESFSIGDNQVIQSLEGIEIRQQMPFHVVIDGFEKWRYIREVIVALEGVQGRAVF